MQFKPLFAAPIVAGLASVTLVVANGTSQTKPPAQGAARLDRDYPVQPISFEAVRLTDAFWAPKIDINPDDWNALLAYFPSTDFGRLAVSPNGTARRWAESDFLTALSRYNTPVK